MTKMILHNFKFTGFILFLILTGILNNEASAAIQPVKFYAPNAFITGGGFLYGVVKGDFNGDGKLDVLSSDDYNIYVFFGDGRGNFSQPPKIVYSGDFRDPLLPTAGDFNGDGRSDVAVTGDFYRNGQGVGVLIFFGNSDGTFSMPVQNPSSVRLTTLLPVDYDGDSKLDLIGVRNNYNEPTITFLRGGGDGTLTSGARFNTGYAPRSVHLGDFNGDGLPDITYNSSDDLMIVKNTGSGTFAPPVKIEEIAYGVTAIASADIDKDGKRDIITVQNVSFDPTVIVLLGNGDFTFRDGGDFDIPSRESIYLNQIGDVDRDNNPDLIFSSLNRIIVSRGTGTKTFAEPQQYVAGGRDSVLGDYNSDGWLDLASVESAEYGIPGSGGFVVLPNLGDGTFLAAPALATGDDTKDVAVGDFNNDNLKDLVVIKRGGGGGPGSIILVFQQAAKQFSTADKTLADEKKYLAQYGLDPYAVVTGDFNQDGKLDFAAVGHGGYGDPENALVALNNGAGSFSQPKFFQINSGDLYKVKTADFNGDGRLDLLTTGVFRGVSVSFGIGNGNFAAPVNYLNDAPISATTVGDFNNDGKTDIAAANSLFGSDPGKIIILQNNGDGNFTSAGTFTASGGLYDLATGYINNDNNLDLVIATTKGATVLNGNGNGVFNGEIKYSIAPISASRVTVADFNGDGKSDIALIASANVISVLLNNGFGELRNETLWAGGADLQTMVSADLNNDGKPDIITGFNSSSSGYINILFNITEPQSIVRSTPFDFDGDGKADLSVFRPSNGIWYLLNSAIGFGGIQFGSAGDRIVPADYDGDGKTDIAVYRNGEWFIQRSAQGFISFQFGRTDDIPIAADFDGDGQADSAVYRPTDGTWFIRQSMLGLTAAQFGINGDRPAAADYDGDGKADLAVFRPSNGIWYVQQSRDGFTGRQFGASEDKIVPADYDGDGRTDYAVYRPSNGVWYLQCSADGFRSVQFGINTDLPTAADFDGDGRADISVYRANTWFLRNSATQTFTTIQFGSSGDKPAPNAFVF